MMDSDMRHLAAGEDRGEDIRFPLDEASDRLNGGSGEDHLGEPLPMLRTFIVTQKFAFTEVCTGGILRHSNLPKAPAFGRGYVLCEPGAYEDTDLGVAYSIKRATRPVGGWLQQRRSHSHVRLPARLECR